MPGPPVDDTQHTRNDGVRAPIWLGHEAVIQMRDWETDQVYPMPGTDVAEPIIGSGPALAVQLIDSTRSVSRQHARLVRVDSGWEIEDISRYGIRCDGGRATSKRFLIAPGMEIGIGGITLIAENASLISLRRYLARVLGWDGTNRPAINLALRAVRAAGHRRAPLALAGTDDLIAVARQIHLRVTLPAAPFIVCGKRVKADMSVPVTATVADASAALEQAAGGTVCVRVDKRFADLGKLVEATLQPRARAQLYQCTTTKKRSKSVDATGAGIVVPSLARRDPGDIDRIVTEYAFDAARELGADPAAPATFTDAQRAWVARKAVSSFADVEITTLRIIARNTSSSTNQAALRLGLSHVALGDWFKRRGLKI